MAVIDPAQEIGNSSDFDEIRAKVRTLVQAVAPDHDMTRIERAFTLIEDGCAGRLADYVALRTPYHDQDHILEVVLCTARLLHALHLDGEAIAPLTIDASIVGALLHDAGYLMREGEAAGTGAQFTLAHVARGVVFAEIHLSGLFPPDLMVATNRVILATDHRPGAVMPPYDSPAERLAAHVTATADLVAQMANREYLERLLLLFLEFREAGIDTFTDIHDLFEKSDGFFQSVAARLENELGGLAPRLVRHFEVERGVCRNFYLEAVARNIDYLAVLLKGDRQRRLDGLRRGGIVARVQKRLEE